MIKKSIYSSIVPSKPEALRGVIETIINRIKKHNISVKLKQDEIYLVLDEALTNAMEHGNRWDPEKSVSVFVIKGGSSLRVCIEDDGDGFDTDGIEKKSCRNYLDYRGRGIRLIRQFCFARWNTKGNRIELFIDYKN